MADQSPRLPLQHRAQSVEPLAALRRTADDRHVEAGERLEGRQFRGAFVGRHEVDLVHADDRFCPAAQDGDEETVDEPRTQRRRLERYDIDHDVDVRGDQPLQVRVERVGTGQNGMPRQDGADAPVAAVGRLDGNAVADGEHAFLTRGDLWRHEAVFFDTVVEDAAAPAGDVDDDRRVARFLLRNEPAETSCQQLVECRAGRGAAPQTGAPPPIQRRADASASSRGPGFRFAP